MRITSRDPTPPPPDYARASGGLFLDLTIHDFDMARFVTGSKVDTIFAFGAHMSDAAHDGFRDIDTAVIILIHANGCLTSIDNSRRTAYGYDQRVEVHGDAGMVSSENVVQPGAVLWSTDGMNAPLLIGSVTERYVDSFIAQWEVFVRALRRGESPPIGLTDAKAALTLAHCAALSAREQRPVHTWELQAPPDRGTGGKTDR